MYFPVLYVPLPPQAGATPLEDVRTAVDTGQCSGHEDPPWRVSSHPPTTSLVYVDLLSQSGVLMHTMYDTMWVYGSDPVKMQKWRCTGKTYNFEPWTLAYAGTDPTTKPRTPVHAMPCKLYLVYILRPPHEGVRTAVVTGQWSGHEDTSYAALYHCCVSSQNSYTNINETYFR